MLTYLRYFYSIKNVQFKLSNVSVTLLTFIYLWLCIFNLCILCFSYWSIWWNKVSKVSYQSFLFLYVCLLYHFTGVICIPFIHLKSTIFIGISAGEGKESCYTLHPLLNLLHQNQLYVCFFFFLKEVSCFLLGKIFLK